MIAHRTMSDETDLWLEMQHARNITGRALSVPVSRAGARGSEDVPACELTDAEIDWLWPRYQRCNFPPATFAKRFATTSRDRLTDRGKNAAVSLSYRYRRQILGKVAVNWSRSKFLDAVRRIAANNFSAGEPKDPAREIVSSASTAPISPGKECPGASHDIPASAGDTADAGNHTP